jgi:type IV pilus assembly protein PilV
MQLKSHLVASRRTAMRRTRGFSLVEVLVALLVISIGLLGIAKMQALALSNTAGARVRALAAIEADSLSATLQADRNFWSKITGATGLTVTVTTSASAAATITASPSDATLTGAIDCTTAAGSAAPCTAHKMAAYDLQQWAKHLQEVMGGPNGGKAFASVVCSAASGTTPVSCTITLIWAESVVAANSSESTSASSALTNASYTVVVNP